MRPGRRKRLAGFALIHVLCTIAAVAGASLAWRATIDSVVRESARGAPRAQARALAAAAWTMAARELAAGRPLPRGERELLGGWIEVRGERLAARAPGAASFEGARLRVEVQARVRRGPEHVRAGLRLVVARRSGALVVLEREELGE